MRLLPLAVLTALLCSTGVLPASADPPKVGTLIKRGEVPIVCLKDVAADVYKGITKASEAKPRMDALMAKKVCGIIVIPIDLTITAVTEVGRITTDLSATQETDDVYSLTAEPPDKSGHIFVLWAETAPPSI